MSSGLLSVKVPFWGAGFGAKLEGGGRGGGWVGFRDEASGFRAAALPKTKRCRNHREGHRNGSGKAILKAPATTESLRCSSCLGVTKTQKNEYFMVTLARNYNGGCGHFRTPQARSPCRQ